jgi:hypothetical protein
VPTTSAVGPDLRPLTRPGSRPIRGGSLRHRVSVAAVINPSATNTHMASGLVRFGHGELTRTRAGHGAPILGPEPRPGLRAPAQQHGPHPAAQLLWRFGRRCGDGLRRHHSGAAAFAAVRAAAAQAAWSPNPLSRQAVSRLHPVFPRQRTRTPPDRNLLLWAKCGRDAPYPRNEPTVFWSSLRDV